MLFVVQCLKRPQSQEESAEQLNDTLDFFAQTLEYFAQTKNELVSAGPLLTEDNEETLGSMWVLNAASRAELDRFLNAGPFFKSDLCHSITVHQWLVLFGSI